jgi:hypothetical protein
MDTVATSQTVVATLKMLYGEPDDQGVLQLSQHWAVENPALFADFFTPANMTFAIAAEVGANLATFMPSRRLALRIAMLRTRWEVLLTREFQLEIPLQL